MTMQAVLVGGKNPQFIGQTTTAVSFRNDMTFNYPPGQPGDTLIAYVVAENLILPAIPTGWTALYSNTTTAVDGPGAARVLMWRKRGFDNSANTVVSGGGNCTCVNLRGFLDRFENITEFVANNSIGNTVFTQTINTQQLLLTMVHQDGGTNDATISIQNTTATFANTPGYYRSMAVGYNLGAADDPIDVSVSSDAAYGIRLTIL